VALIYCATRGKPIVNTIQQKTWLGYLSLVRILVGIQFLLVAWPKVAGGRFLSKGGRDFADQLLHGASQDPLAWHRAFITGFVVPHAHFFSYLVAFGEMAIAISLITGCLVRVSSCFGAFHNANIYLALAYAAGGATLNYNRLLILLHIIFVCSSAGRVLGIDGLLAKRFPRSPLF
jgi:thiosulfate dehydrogenase [quinone] large subunit